jgi:hypothetical protein
MVENALLGLFVQLASSLVWDMTLIWLLLGRGFLHLAAPWLDNDF